jgi:hypothetical protein
MLPPPSVASTLSTRSALPWVPLLVTLNGPAAVLVKLPPAGIVSTKSLRMAPLVTLSALTVTGRVLSSEAPKPSPWMFSTGSVTGAVPSRSRKPVNFRVRTAGSRVEPAAIVTAPKLMLIVPAPPMRPVAPIVPWLFEKVIAAPAVATKAPSWVTPLVLPPRSSVPACTVIVSSFSMPLPVFVVPVDVLTR